MNLGSTHKFERELVAIKNNFKLKAGSSSVTIGKLFDQYLQMFKKSYPNYASQIDDFIHEVKTVLANEVREL